MATGIADRVATTAAADDDDVPSRGTTRPDFGDAVNLIGVSGVLSLRAVPR